MAYPEIRPKIEHLTNSTSKLENDMEDVKDRLVRVEMNQDQQGKMLRDIHMWAGWFFKTIIGSVIIGVLSFIIKIIFGV